MSDERIKNMSESSVDESLDDCAACDARLSTCSPDAACCDDCTHGANFAPRSTEQEPRP